MERLKNDDRFICLASHGSQETEGANSQAFRRGTPVEEQAEEHARRPCGVDSVTVSP